MIPMFFSSAWMILSECHESLTGPVSKRLRVRNTSLMDFIFSSKFGSKLEDWSSNWEKCSHDWSLLRLCEKMMSREHDCHVSIPWTQILV